MVIESSQEAVLALVSSLSGLRSVQQSCQDLRKGLDPEGGAAQVLAGVSEAVVSILEDITSNSSVAKRMLYRVDYIQAITAEKVSLEDEVLPHMLAMLSGQDKDEGEDSGEIGFDVCAQCEYRDHCPIINQLADN